ncbi:MAG: cadherin repeat domain-containing protein [Bacteroidales bacterium]|nr:MAG: cadherin repeat domain-containing protein [Bacteroidales bacterium]
MLRQNISFISIMVKYFIIIIAVFLSINLTAQNDTIPTLYKDSTGKLFIAKGTHVYLFIGTSPEGSKSFRLKGDNGNEPLHWSNHGLKRLTHLNLDLGRKVNLDLFADALPPKSSVGYDSEKVFQKANTTYLSGLCVIELSAKDPDAGLNGIYYSINDGTNIKYNEPISLKSEGSYKLTVFALDNVGNKEEEATHTIVVDNTPPLSNLDLIGDKFENIVSGRSTLALTSADAIGVKQTLYKIDSSKLEIYTKPISTSSLSEGEHTISWYSIDEVGNTENPKSFTFFVDKTPPMVFEEIVGNTYIVAGKEYSSGRSQLRIAAVDNKSGVKEINYSLNNSPFVSYEKPVYLSDIMGSVSLKSFAIDNVGNRSKSDTQSESFSMPMVDITGPQIRKSFIGPKMTIRDTLWIGPKTKISITTNDIGAGVSKVNYRLKGGDEKLYTEPFTLETGGKHEMVCTAYDNVDNVNLLSFNFCIDNQPPSIYHHFSIEPSGWLNENDAKIPIFSKGIKLYLAATDNVSGVEKLGYILNGAREIKYGSPIEGFKTLTTYTLLIKTIDFLGNASEKTITFRVE